MFPQPKSWGPVSPGPHGCCAYVGLLSTDGQRAVVKCGCADVATGKLQINFAEEISDVMGKMRRCGFLTYGRTTAMDDEDNDGRRQTT